MEDDESAETKRATQHMVCVSTDMICCKVCVVLLIRRFFVAATAVTPGDQKLGDQRGKKRLGYVGDSSTLIEASYQVIFVQSCRFISNWGAA